jgi:hypothetical protein
MLKDSWHVEDSYKRILFTQLYFSGDFFIVENARVELLF